jgi:hypothetical protein
VRLRAGTTQKTWQKVLGQNASFDVGVIMAWFPGEDLLKKMWDSLIDKGVGTLLEPWHTRRQGAATLDVRRAEILGIAEAERQAQEIRAGQRPISEVAGALLSLPPPVELKGGATQRPTVPALPSLTEIALRATVADGMRREAHVARAIIYAEQELLGDESAPDDREVEADWLYRWRDYASQVSGDQLQSLWGKLLAGEVKKPGAYSLRTLDFARNLSTDEAKLIERLSPFVLVDFVCRSDEKLLEKEGLRFGELLALQDLGILSGVESLGLSMTLESDTKDSYSKALLCHGRVLIATHNEPSKTIELGAYPVTNVGRQIMALGKFAANEEYLRKVGGQIKAQGFEVEIADVVDIKKGSIRVENRKPFDAAAQD